MNYLQKTLKESFRPIRSRNEFQERIETRPPLKDVRALAEKMGMPKTTLYRWLSNPAQRNFSDEQLEILHNQLHWRHFDLDGNQIIHIKQTHDILERDRQEDEMELRLGSFGKHDRFPDMTEQLKKELTKIIEDEKSKAVKRSLQESTARVNILTEQLRVSQQQVAELSKKLSERDEREAELKKSLDFATMVADRFSYFAKQQEELREQIQKLAS